MTRFDSDVRDALRFAICASMFVGLAAVALVWLLYIHDRRVSTAPDPETAAWLEEAEQVSAMTIADPVLDATATAVVP